MLFCVKKKNRYPYIQSLRTDLSRFEPRIRRSGRTRLGGTSKILVVVGPGTRKVPLPSPCLPVRFTTVVRSRRQVLYRRLSCIQFRSVHRLGYSFLVLLYGKNEVSSKMSQYTVSHTRVLRICPSLTS